jgi:hypothetical protein
MTAPAYFEFRGEHETDRFVIKLVDPKKIEHARRIVRGEETRFIHVMGTIIVQRVAYNQRWRFHLKPDSIEFFENEHLERCDGAMGLIEQDLDRVGGSFLPKGFWCPWASILTREVEFTEP